MLRVLDAAAIQRWVDASVDLLEAHRDELDRINVYPVADGDTGTNLTLTLRAAAEELARRSPLPGRTDSPAEVAAALARGALRGARGNSGMIISQLPRGLAEVLAEAAVRGGRGEGPVLAAALARADELARAAVSRPVEGTVLTVLRAAADSSAAAAENGGTLADVVAAAVDGSTVALADTPRRLPVLARAGVVDAGGRGLVLLLEALARVVAGSDRRPGGAVSGGAVSGGAASIGAVSGGAASIGAVASGGGRPRCRDVLEAERESGSAEFDYEVMYLLEGSTDGRMAALRERLVELGDSVAVVGDGAPGGTGTWHVHAHCTDVGAVLEAGVEAGRPHRVTVVRFADQRRAAEVERAGRFPLARAVVTVVDGEAVARLVRGTALDGTALDGTALDGTALDGRTAGAGVAALVAPPGSPPRAAEIAAAVAGTRAAHVVVLPNDVELTAVAEEAAEQARAGGVEVVVVPTSSVLQGLAALAVHDPARRAGDDVVAMAEAAAATRTGVVEVATGDALTWVGRCRAGDVLGLVDGEVVLIEHDLATAACQLADRMLTTGGELVTVLLGDDPARGEGDGLGSATVDGGHRALGALLAAHLRRTHPEVEVLRYLGGPPERPIQLGVE